MVPGWGSHISSTGLDRGRRAGQDAASGVVADGIHVQTQGYMSHLYVHGMH